MNFIYSLFILVLLSCAASPNHKNLNSRLPPIPEGTGNRIATIEPLLFDATEVRLSEDFVQKLSLQVKEALLKSGRYSQVYQKQELPQNQAADHWKFRFQIDPQLSYAWYSYAAIYPFVGIWPFQSYEAFPLVKLKATKVSQEGDLKTYYAESRGEVNQLLYGFYFKPRLANKLAELHAEVVQKTFQSLRQNSAQGTPETTRDHAPSRMPFYAIQGFEAKGSSQEEADLIADYLASELSAKRGLRLMERAQIKEILKEQEFQNSGACDGSECQVEIGKFLGVDYLIAGSLGKLGNRYVMNLRVISVETGESVFHASETTKGDLGLLLEEPMERLVQSFHTP